MSLAVKIVFLIFTVLLFLYGAGAQDEKRSRLFTAAALVLAVITIAAVKLI